MKSRCTTLITPIRSTSYGVDSEFPGQIFFILKQILHNSNYAILDLN